MRFEYFNTYSVKRRRIDIDSKLQAQELSWQAYHCNFIECDYRTCRVLTMFTRVSERHPIVIRANGMFTFQLNLGLFLSVCLWSICMKIKKNRCELLFLVDSENDIFICGVDYPAEVIQAQTQLLLNQLLVNIHRILFKNFWSKKYIFKQNAKKLHKNHITQNDNLPKYSLGLGILFHWKWVFFRISNSKNSKSNRNYCGIIPKCEQLERHRVCHRWTVSDTKIIAYDFVAQYFIACDVPI